MEREVMIMAKWVCSVCGYVHEGDEPPENCPVCKAPAEKFKEHPEFNLQIKFMIEEKDMVAVYLKNVDPQGNTRVRVVDIYRLVEGKLAEHWDVLQPVTIPSDK